MKLHRSRPVSQIFAVGCLLTASLFAQTGADRALRSGTFRGRPITFRAEKGLAIVEGDIVLAPLDQISDQVEVQSLENRLTPHLDSAILLSATNSSWPLGKSIAEIPYFNRSGNLEVEQAVQQFNQALGDPVSGSVRWISWTGQPDYVEFDFQVSLNSYCTGHSSIGRVGGAQSINVTGIGCVSVILHEMGHAIGLMHEHNRQDRGNYVAINWANLPSDSISRAQYTQAFVGGQDVGAFDYSSIMIYDYSLPGVDPHLTNLVTIPRGVVLRPSPFYSATDIDAIRRIYGPFNRTGVTVTTNPPGLQTLVDCSALIANCRLQIGTSVFNWNLNSTHHLDVPRDATGAPVIQTVKALTTTYYQFARWNDVLEFDPLRPPDAAHAITILPGDDSLLSPKNLPRVTTYVANFVKLNPGWLAATARPSPSAGSITISESPVVIGRALYHPAKAPVTVLAKPNPGFSFYCWQDGQPASIGFVKPGCLSVSGSANPRQINIDAARNRTVAALFTANPVTLVTTNPPGLPFQVDGVAYTGDNAFAQDLDLGWIRNFHGFAAPASQPAQSADAGAVLWFSSWTVDDRTISPYTVAQIPIGAVPPKKIVANYIAAFPLNVSQNANFAGNSSYPCAGSFAYLATPPVPAPSATPPAPPLYYGQTIVNVTALPRNGWYFTGWDDPTLKNPAIVLMDSTRQLIANFNTAPDALAATSLFPPVASANGRDLDLTVSGSGFTSRTTYCFYNERATSPSRCGGTTPVSPTQLFIHVGADLLIPGHRLELEMQNDDGQSCQVRSARAFLPVQ